MDKVFHPSKFNIDAEELMQKAGYAGAITVLMHPNATFDNQEELDEVRKKLYSWGLFGEEKIYANKETMAKLTQPKENGVSGGTDSHNVYTKKLAIVDGIQLYADMFSITKKLEELEEKRKQNPKREDKEIADVSYIKYVPKYQNNMTPQDVMNKYKKITLAKKTEELEK